MPGWRRQVQARLGCGFLAMVAMCASCGTRKGLSSGAIDAGTDVAPGSDAGADHATVHDVRLAAEDDLTRDTLGHDSDTAMGSDVQAACAPLPVAWLPEPMVAMCPPTADSSACAGGDVGAVVARTGACAHAWGNVLFQCVMWKPPADGEEIVVIELANCADGVDTVAAAACSDHIAISYVTRGSCQACDGKRSSLRAFTLPLDPRPIIATGQHIEPPCRPPPPPDAAPVTGGATGAGGVSGVGGAGGAGGNTAAGGAGGGCAQAPISESQAATAYAAYVTPSLDPGVSYEAEEKIVPGLWEEMQAQLFTGKIFPAGSSTASSQCSFVYRDCGVTLLTEDCDWFGPILSGAVKSGTFYYSWEWGSGVYRTFLSKLAFDGTGVVKMHSDPYFNPDGGPPPLVIARESDQLVVYRATVYWEKFNEWLDPELIGTLVDYGDRLAIADSNGREVPSELPP